MRVTIEYLPLSDPKDAKALAEHMELLQRQILGAFAMPADQLLNPTPTKAVAVQADAAHKRSEQSAALDVAVDSARRNLADRQDTKREMTTQTAALAEASGEPKKPLTKSEHARVAAQARWARIKAARDAGQPAPAKVAPADPKFARAEQQSPEQFKEVPGEDFVMTPVGPMEKLPYPDGRDILEGTYEDQGQPDGTIPDTEGGDADETELRQRAADASEGA